MAAAAKRGDLAFPPAALAFCFSQEVYEMLTNFLTNSTKFLLGSLLFLSMGTAVAGVVDCPKDSIQN